jgi:hypothetical protein
MRLSQWRAEAPTREAMGQKVLAVVVPVLADLGATDDPDCWVHWGEDPAVRYSILVPTIRGLAQCHVRVNVPGEGPRASGKVVRWARVQVGELAVEVTHGHRLVTSQVEGLVLKGVDDVADRVARFVLSIYDAIDGRPIVADVHARPARRARTAARRTPRQPIPLPAPKG